MGSIVGFFIVLFVGIAIASARQKKKAQSQQSAPALAPMTAYTTNSAAQRRLEPEEFAGYFETSVFEVVFGPTNDATKPYWMAVKIRPVPGGLMLFPPPSMSAGVPSPPVTVMWDAIESAGSGVASSTKDGAESHSVVRLLLAKLDDSQRTPVGTIATLHLYDPGGAKLARQITTHIAGRSVSPAPKPATAPRPAVAAPAPASVPSAARPAVVNPVFATPGVIVAAAAAVPAADTVSPAPAEPAPLVAAEQPALHPGDAAVLPELPSIEVAEIPDYNPTYVSSGAPTYEPTDFSTPYAATNLAPAQTDVAADGTTTLTDSSGPAQSGFTITPPTIAAPWPPPQQFRLPGSVDPDAHADNTGH